MSKPDPTALSSRRKQALVVLAAGHLVWAIVAVGAPAADRGDLAVDAEVEQLGVSGTNVTSLTLTVTNNGNESIEPVFRVVSDGWHTQNAWTVVDGPETLAPGETASYTIQAPGERARVEPPARMLVIIQDHQRRATIGPKRLVVENNSSSGGRTHA